MICNVAPAINRRTRALKSEKRVRDLADLCSRVSVTLRLSQKWRVQCLLGVICIAAENRYQVRLFHHERPEKVR